MIAEFEPFEVPPALEATEPPEYRGVPRDGVRLLVTSRATGGNRDLEFEDFAQVLRAGDLVVVNDSATLAAAVDARRRDGTALALHFSARVHDHLWLVEPRGPVLRSEEVALPDGGALTFLVPRDPFAPRLWYAAAHSDTGVAALMRDFGHPIRYSYVTSAYPLSAYQTIFSSVPGSAEMPSAGRPFTPATLGALRAAGVSLATVTLHGGVSSFERRERPAPEPYRVSHAAVRAVEAAQRRGGRVVAVGTTVVRALETAASPDGRLLASAGWSDLIVTRERGVRVVDALLTGFHEARSEPSRPAGSVPAPCESRPRVRTRDRRRLSMARVWRRSTHSLNWQRTRPSLCAARTRMYGCSIDGQVIDPRKQGVARSTKTTMAYGTTSSRRPGSRLYLADRVR